MIRFSSFRLWPFYPTGVNIGSNRPQHVLKHAEKQPETRRVQSPEPVQIFLVNLKLKLFKNIGSCKAF